MITVTVEEDPDAPGRFVGMLEHDDETTALAPQDTAEQVIFDAYSLLMHARRKDADNAYALISQHHREVKP